MQEKIPPPALFADLAPLWVFFVGVLAALVGYLEDFKPEDTVRVKVLKAATRLASSAFAAVLTWHAVRAMGIPEGWHVPIVGISGHMGVESLKLAGELLRSWANRKAAGGAP